MNTQFATAMRRASQQMRAQNLAEATRLIQEALNGRPRVDNVENDATPRREELLSSVAREDVASAAGGADRLARMRAPLGDPLCALRQDQMNPDAFAGLPGMASSGLQTRAPSIPHGARFETRSFSCAAGSRSYKLYVPASAAVRPRGLVIMLHGCTQNSNDFALGTGMNEVAEARGFAVAYPGQTRSDNPSSCWNWFEPKDQRRGAGEPAILAGLTQEIVAEFGIDPAQVFIAGLSAGGAMAAVMAETYPELYAAVGVHSGLPTNAAKDVVSAFATMRGDPKATHPKRGGRRAVRAIVFQGSADKTVHPSNAERIMDAATPDAATVFTRKVAGLSGRRGATITVVSDPAGETVAERWLVDDAGHAWSGGRAGGTYVDPNGPDASAEMMRFFLRETLRS
ncbi:extracellular catalytic domain type 1 short-chain-length polyhydroxyalkanoate depolymerase [Hansschlegelia zhihuaiae]|uniref:PHB depolymerase family esterase n=1 Tax=Hansschlegelia zhihuaiae TaxID=405005 RepID=A0A4Q0M854_9HYPH|nr:PHB depolymerase family esterase [Hansschlegelia zhihuaiae]RXF69215.1 PHB depolymerase family esterase [Hansschlegelia zhihuaiae]